MFSPLDMLQGGMIYQAYSRVNCHSFSPCMHDPILRYIMGAVFVLIIDTDTMITTHMADHASSV